MKKFVPIICSIAAIALCTGCAVDGVGGGPVAYDGFYDGYYGPFYDGYWGNDGFFYYSDGEGHAFRRDEANHFRHNGGMGFHGVHGRVGGIGRAGSGRGRG